MNPFDEMADRQHRLDSIVKKINSKKEANKPAKPTSVAHVVPPFMQRWDQPPLLPMEKMDLFEQAKGRPQPQQRWDDRNMWQYFYNAKHLQSLMPPQQPIQPPPGLLPPPIQPPSVQPPPIQRPPIQPPPIQRPPIQPRPFIPDICYCNQWMPGSVCTPHEYYSDECYVEPHDHDHNPEPDFEYGTY